MEREALQFLAEQFEPFTEVSEGVVAKQPGVKLESLERFQDQPDRIRKKVVLSSTDSFCQYVDRYKSAGSTVYLDTDAGRIVSVIDHHELDAPSWCQHQAIYEPTRSNEWEIWASAHDVWMNQLQFATMLEDLLHTVKSPEPSVLLSAALDFQDNSNMTLASTQNLDNGDVRFLFQKDNARDSVDFPHRIKLYFPVFENETPQDFDARIRYKASGDGVLSFKFSFVSLPKIIVRDELREIAKNVREKTVGLHHYEGRFPEERGMAY